MKGTVNGAGGGDINIVQASPPRRTHSSNKMASAADSPDAPPLPPFDCQDNESPTPSLTLQRHLSLTDLLAIGIGGTVGSGMFVLTGQIAATQAGSATALCWTFAGAAATLSGISYAELAAHLPGSSYAYARTCFSRETATVATSDASHAHFPRRPSAWNNVLPLVAAACLTLEYGVSGAAVARSWGDKVVLYLEDEWHWDGVRALLMPLDTINLPACLVSLASTALLLAGVRESKQVTNLFTLLKLVLVAFMIVVGFSLFRFENWTNPTSRNINRENDDNIGTAASSSWPPFGWSGVLRGATSSFFGYLGYDEVCVVAAEAIHPSRDMPRAVLGTLWLVTACYVLAALALTGMLPAEDLSPTSGFPAAFFDRGLTWAAQIAAAGEIITLPVVVLISLMAQPRLLYSMSQDGLLPSSLFAATNGNLYGGTLISGILMTVIASSVPFTYLDDLISCGVLTAFNLSNACLVLLRCEPATSIRATLHNTSPHRLYYLLGIYNVLCFTSTILWSHELSLFTSYGWQTSWAVLTTVAVVGCMLYMAWLFPSTPRFGGCVAMVGGQFHQHRHQHASDHSTSSASTTDEPAFRTPCVPYLPCAGTWVNWYLIAQLEVSGLLLLGLYLAMTVLLYQAYGWFRFPEVSSFGFTLSPTLSTNGNYHAVLPNDDMHHVESALSSADENAEDGVSLSALSMSNVGSETIGGNFAYDSQRPYRDDLAGPRGPTHLHSV